MGVDESDYDFEGEKNQKKLGGDDNALQDNSGVFSDDASICPSDCGNCTQQQRKIRAKELYGRLKECQSGDQT